MKIVVLGAGVVGVTSAWYLARAGHDVVVIDRQPAPALETSFANGGQVAVSHAEPWANPGTLRRIPQWLWQRDAPMAFHPQPDWHQWLWMLRFLVECLPSRAERNTKATLALALYSLRMLQALRAETGIEYEGQSTGILHFYTDTRALDRAIHAAETLKRAGIAVQVKSADECVALEPAFGPSRARIAGGLYTPSDESGDAHKFTSALAALAARLGVQFRFNTSVEFIDARGGEVASVAVRNDDGTDDRVRGDAYVVALGSYSSPVLRAIGIGVPVYPAKGYSITIDLAEGDVAPEMSLNDEAYKLVYSHLGNQLRVAGTASLEGYNTEIDPARCEAIVRRTFALFPRAGRPERAQFWTGLRPATPSNLPCIGRTKMRNLFLNTGHGTLGWTLACGSGASLAQIVSGARPPVEFPFLSTLLEH
ncbi:MAG: D-amino acid dehydrogenase [Betaproteobacteria bacterium]|nr:D-amino acid dehydrogenase [Betaproteobacteria bacterium]